MIFNCLDNSWDVILTSYVVKLANGMDMSIMMLIVPIESMTNDLLYLDTLK